jgi:hypothetical protein
VYGIDVFLKGEPKHQPCFSRSRLLQEEFLRIHPGKGRRDQSHREKKSLLETALKTGRACVHSHVGKGQRNTAAEG